MSIYYHGTDAHTATKILKDGFKAGTYFTWDLHSALGMGGLWVFGVFFDGMSPEKSYWELITPERMPPERILYLRKFTAMPIYDNEAAQEELRKTFNREAHGKDVIHCQNCKGRGQMNTPKLYSGGFKHAECIPCEVCAGFGCLRADGKKINEP